MINPAPNPESKREIVRDPRILLGVIAYGGMVHGQWMCSVTDALQTLAVEIDGRSLPLIGATSHILGDSLVCRARNNMAHCFLRGRDEDLPDGRKITRQYDFLLFVDTDIVFSAGQIGRLYSHAVQRGLKVVCGLYPIKSLKPRFVVNAIPGETPDAEGLVRVRDAGTGLMLIHRDVFARLIQQFSDEMVFVADDDDMSIGETRHDFFSVGPRYDPWARRRRYLSEDYFFTQRCIEAGIDVFMDTRVQARHIGQMIYPVSAEMFFEALKVYEKLRAAASVNSREPNQETNSSNDRQHSLLPIGAKSVPFPLDDRAQTDCSDMARPVDTAPTRAADDTAPGAGRRDGGDHRLGGADRSAGRTAAARTEQG